MIKWGVLGTAGIAKGCTIPGMQLASNCELTAIAGRSLEKAEQFQKEFGFEKAYGSYEELLADPDVQAVYIPLPNELHYEWTIKALKAGKHVLCEKPLAPTEKEIEEMFRTAKENNVYLMEAFAYLHSPIVSAIKEELDNGTIGEIRYMENAFLTSDYDMSNIRMRKETFGGSTYDLGCYCTSQILWMMGQEPKTVQAVADFSQEGIDKLTTGFMVFESGARASFTCGMTLETEKDYRIDRLQIFGTKGKIVSDVAFNQEGKCDYTICIDGKKITKTVTAPQNYALEVEQLGQCITGEETPCVSEDFSLKNVRILERILKQIGY